MEEVKVDLLEVMNDMQVVADSLVVQLNEAIKDESGKVYFRIKDVSLSRPLIESTAGDLDYYHFLFTVKVRHLDGIMKINFGVTKSTWSSHPGNVHITYEPFALKWINKVSYTRSLELRYTDWKDLRAHVAEVATKVHSYYLKIKEIEDRVKNDLHNIQERDYGKKKESIEESEGTEVHN